MEEGPETDALDPQFPKLNYQNPTTNHGHSIRTHLFMPNKRGKKRDFVIFLFFSPAHLKTRSQKNPLSPALDGTREGVIQRGEREREESRHINKRVSCKPQDHQRQAGGDLSPPH